MKLATLRKLIIEADPVTGEEVKKRLPELGALDCVAVRRAERVLPPVEVPWFERGDMVIEAVADSQRIDTILDELSGSFGDDAHLDVIVSDMFGYPLFRWHRSVGKRHVPREVYWASQLLTM